MIVHFCYTFSSSEYQSLHFETFSPPTHVFWNFFYIPCFCLSEIFVKLQNELIRTKYMTSKSENSSIVPPFVTAHKFCASRDVRLSQGICPLIQQYFCAFYDCVEKADLSKGYQNPESKKKIGGNQAFFRDN